MDNVSSAPIGVSLVASSPLHQAAKSTPDSGDGEAISVDHRPEDNPRTVEDNPRPVIVPEQAGSKELDSASALPLAVDVIPPTFSQSSWARRNAIIRSVRRWVPTPIRLIIHILMFVAAFGCIVFIPAIPCVPGAVAMVLGNAICKAANLPSFQTSSVAPFITGISAGALAVATCVPLLFPLCNFCNVLDDRYKARYILSGRLPANSTRKDSHFPIMFLWIPFFYIICVITGAYYAYSLSGGPAQQRPSRFHMTQMGAVGGVFAAPLCTFAIPITAAVLEIIFNFNGEVIQGHPGKTGPIISAFLARQFEALVWLFSSQKSAQASRTTDSSDEPASVLIGGP